MKKVPFHKSFLFSLKGLAVLLKSERNFQIHMAGLIVNLFLMVVFKTNVFETCAILIVSFGVLITEALNTCIEKICDYIQPQQDSRIGIIKDMAAGAVTLSAVLAICIGILVYWPYLRVFFLQFLS